jgi:hypothetical protein
MVYVPLIWVLGTRSLVTRLPVARALISRLSLMSIGTCDRVCMHRLGRTPIRIVAVTA